MDEFLTAFAPVQFLGLEQIMLSFLLSFVLCSIIAGIYTWTFQGFSYSRSFVHTLILSGVIVCMLIMAIGNNLARGLGILGTLAIVRFRTPVRDPRDMMFLFATLGIGIACGANTFNVAILGTLTIAAVTLILHWSPFASRREYEGLLRFMLPAEFEHEADVQDVMRECCSSFALIAMREAVQGDMIEYSYHVKLLDPTYQADLVDGLHGVEGLIGANLLMHRTTVEL
ncbi:MAG: DUF4956 domain-containing protein [Kiritimatiellae bacterium]|jgi:uncharacterized membrane protein YhiD involved in acid resistance|nr:DUF4956 domain-containing protein [Kiritimatiellia bacterium]